MHPTRRIARFATTIIGAFVSLSLAVNAHAGMPSIALNDLAHLRLEVISFFLVVLLLATLVIQQLWNWLRRDWPHLPRLSYLRALGLMTLWGLLFVLVLTMISGARELMTPGAWERSGVAYHLKQTDAVASKSARWTSLAVLKGALWQYAATHDGVLPPDEQASGIADRAWQTPEVSRIHYTYVGGKIDAGTHPVAYEPSAFPPPRLVLCADGVIREMSDVELSSALLRMGVK